MDRRNPNPASVRRSSASAANARRSAPSGSRSASGARRQSPPPRSGRNPSYDGRFGSSADAANRRHTGSYRSQPSGSYRSRMDYSQRSNAPRRPSMHDAGDSYTRRPNPEAAQKPRRSKKRINVGSLLAIIFGMLLLAALIYAVATSGNTVHQLPTVERGNAIITEDL